LDPIRKAVGRAWESLTEGWRELLTRSSGAITRFSGARRVEATPDFPRWSLLAAETWETALSIVIRVEIPGMAKDELDIDIHGNALRIRGEKHPGAEQEGRLYHLMERAYGKFERCIPLPHGVSTEAAEVSYRDGVVIVILPKTEPVPPRPLPVE
jgi:HSP20 family protein